MEHKSYWFIGKIIEVASVELDAHTKMQVIEKVASVMLEDIASRTRPQGLTKTKVVFSRK